MRTCGGHRHLTKPIAVVLPMREQVTSGHAGAVALNVLEFGRVSAFRDRLIVVGAAEPGDFALPYHHVDVGRGVGLSMSWPFWHRASDRYADAVADTILQHGSRLVEVHNRGRLFLQLARRLGPQTRMCLYLHNDPRTMEALETPIERVQLLERASIVYCLSDYIRNRLIDGVEGLSERVVVLPNGTVSLPADRPTREGTILFVGRLIPEKGVEELFDALRHIAALLPDWRVVIIGRAPERHRSRYERTLEELRAIWGERLVLKESVPHAEVMQAYALAAITVGTFALAGAVRPDGTRSPGARLRGHSQSIRRPSGDRGAGRISPRCSDARRNRACYSHPGARPGAARGVGKGRRTSCAHAL